MDELGLTATQVEGSGVGDARPPLIAGAKIGRYVVLDLLGEGAMGQVYTGYDVQLDRKIAIKVLRAALVSTRAQERTLREAKALAQLSHPNVVQVYDLGDVLRYALASRNLEIMASETYSNPACAGSIMDRF